MFLKGLIINIVNLQAGHFFALANALDFISYLVHIDVLHFH